MNGSYMKRNTGSKYIKLLILVLESTNEWAEYSLVSNSRGNGIKCTRGEITKIS